MGKDKEELVFGFLFFLMFLITLVSLSYVCLTRPMPIKREKGRKGEKLFEFHGEIYRLEKIQED